MVITVTYQTHYRDVASYFKVVLVKVHIQHVVYRGFWALPRNFVKLDARRSLLRPISCSVNRVTISTVATCVR